MRSYCLLTIDSEFKGPYFLEFQGNTYYLGLGCSKLKAAHPVNYFPGFLGMKNIKTCPPSKLFLFTSLVKWVDGGSVRAKD